MVMIKLYVRGYKEGNKVKWKCYIYHMLRGKGMDDIITSIGMISLFNEGAIAGYGCRHALQWQRKG